MTYVWASITHGAIGSQVIGVKPMKIFIAADHVTLDIAAVIKSINSIKAIAITMFGDQTKWTGNKFDHIIIFK